MWLLNANHLGVGNSMGGDIIVCNRIKMTLVVKCESRSQSPFRLRVRRSMYGLEFM